MSYSRHLSHWDLRGDVSKTVVIGAYKQGVKFKINSREPARRYFGGTEYKERSQALIDDSKMVPLQTSQAEQLNMRVLNPNSAYKIVPENCQPHPWVTKLDLKSSIVLSVSSNGE